MCERDGNSGSTSWYGSFVQLAKYFWMVTKNMSNFCRLTQFWCCTNKSISLFLQLTQLKKCAIMPEEYVVFHSIENHQKTHTYLEEEVTWGSEWKSPSEWTRNVLIHPIFHPITQLKYMWTFVSRLVGNELTNHSLCTTSLLLTVHCFAYCCCCCHLSILCI